MIRTGERKTATNRAQWFLAPITEEINRVIGAFPCRDPGGFLQTTSPADGKRLLPTGEEER